MADEPRNYLLEALKIARGEEMRIAEKAHLLALVEQSKQDRARVIDMGKVLAALLVDMTVPDSNHVGFDPKKRAVIVAAALMKVVADRRIAVGIRNMPDGSVELVQFQPEAPAPHEVNAPKRVM